MLGKTISAGALALFLGLGAAAFAADQVHVSGSVVDAFSGTPIAGFKVIGRDGSGSEISAVTDAHGKYNMLGVDYGKITLTGAGSGYSSPQVTCKVPSGEAVRFDFKVVHGMPTNKMHATCRVEPNTADRYIIESGNS